MKETMKRRVFIVSAARTGTGGFLGSLSSLSAVQLGAEVMKDAIRKSGIPATDVNEVIFGNVLSANLGQSPARQAARAAGIPDAADATTVNKVCSSGLKSVMYGAQSIAMGDAEVVMAGGMESMSNAPYYLEDHRSGLKTGNQNLVDGMLKDGLWDPYHNFHMGNAAEMANRKYSVSRVEQDEYALNSYRKARQAQENGFFKEEITPLELPGKQGSTIYDLDEDVLKLNEEKMTKLKPIFEAEGSITAANASNLNDGAAALLLASEEYVQAHGLQPLAAITAFADAAQAPEWFSTSPSLAIAKTLQKAGLSMADIDFFEINEAYANVPLINARLSGIDAARLNVNGGAVSIGHPLGASGARILVSLAHILKNCNGRYGMAAICNGGGGASALLIENLQRS
ncbi:MAG: acetyl-CoA C-acyltransferase [Bacteroidia bacterium]|nr:acetyl-CoA C-acyltransferase [Bacteroidia bacterium]